MIAQKIAAAMLVDEREQADPGLNSIGMPCSALTSIDKSRPKIVMGGVTRITDIDSLTEMKLA
jgi:hypothetical protein